MAKILIETPGGKIVTDDGTVLEFRVAYDTAETSGQPLVLIHC